MGLNITSLDQQRAAQSGPSLVADRRLWLADDEKTVVDEGDRRAASLLIGKGHTIPRATAMTLNLSLVDGRVVQNASPAVTQAAGAAPSGSGETSDADTAEKQQALPEDKSLPRTEDKAAPPPADKGGKKKKGFFGKG